jgi:hypothetical protein
MSNHKNTPLEELFLSFPYDPASYRTREDYYSFISRLTDGRVTAGSVGAQYRQIRKLNERTVQPAPAIEHIVVLPPVDLPLSWVQIEFQSNDATPPELPQEIDHSEKIMSDIRTKKDNAKIKEQKSEIDRLKEQYGILMEKYEIALALREHKPDIVLPKVDFGGKQSEGIPIIQYSDWHVEKRIDSRVMNGLNEFNLDICAKRVKNTYSNTVRLIRKERQDVKITTAVINLGGDFINNYLHEHDVQENYLAPIEALFFAKERIKESLMFIAQEAGLTKIVVLCCNGNHPRLTKRMQSDNDYKMNLEAILYHTLKQELSDPIFEWHIPESELGYFKVGDTTIRYFHGHQFNYMGGVGGLTIPLNKTTMRYDQVKKADFNLISHWHTFDLIGGKSSINGSLCGYDPYAQKLGCTFDVPKQSFQILDNKRGFTGRFPILCDQ